ncbi:MAG: hypothetical protein ACI4AB_06755 [Acetatifactor sp.]
MKKSVIKLAVFLATFVLALFIIGKIMNKDHDNLTMVMAPATFPLVTMELEGVEYNQLHGYSERMDVAFQRDTVTVLGESREAEFVIDTFGRDITGAGIELRSADGARLIEDTEITDVQKQEDRIRGTIALKDLIEKDTDYSLTILLELDGTREIYYYTRVVWSDNLHTPEKIDYVTDFHQRLYDREAARELTKYLETNSKLEDNSSFHKVNIHSSFRQITWGDLNVKEVTEPVLYLTEVASQTASFLMDYVVSTSENKETTYYMVEEHYRVRYTSERMYLLDYERTMTQIPNADEMYANDKILLGITETDVPMVESEDGNIVVFEVANRLFSYDVTANKLTVIFSFYDVDNADARTLYRHHNIKILDVDEGGNVQFALYGYMNRGRHEGEVGIQLYTYNSALNTIEELVYIPYTKTYSVLAAEMEQLLYLNREQKLYLELNNTVYSINLVERTCTAIINITQDENLKVSDDHRILVWPEGEDNYRSSVLNIRNLTSDTIHYVPVSENEAIRPLGFMDEDIIYGVARKEDIIQENSGRIFFPMYKVCICNSAGEVLKEYRQDGIYIESCLVEDNQITLNRLERPESGGYRETSQDHITNNMEAETGKNTIVTADIDIYERYVEIKTRSVIDGKTIKILTPKEVVFEGGRELQLPEGDVENRYYVYGPYGVDGIFTSPAGAVNLAYEEAGVVVDGSGDCIWLRGNRATKNQIMAIKETAVTEEKNSLAVCLDTIFQFEGLVRNSEYLLGQGMTVMEILEDNLEDAQILDMTGCSLDAMLYYVNQDIPVLALLENGEAVLVTGFNEYNVVIMEPSTGTLYKKGMNDSTEWFEENGNCFITYTRKNQ